MKELSEIFRQSLHRIAGAGLVGSMTGVQRDLVAGMLETALRDSPDDCRLNNLMGEVLFYEEQYERALPFLEKGAAGAEDGSEHSALLGTCLYELERYGEALPYLEAMAARYPNDTDIRMKAGYILYTQGRYPEARAYLEAALPEIDVRQFQKEISGIMLDGLRHLAPDAPGTPPAPQP